MRKEKISPYIFLGLFLLGVLSSSDSLSRKVRSITVSSLSPTWSLSQEIKKKVLFLGAFSYPQKGGLEKFIREMEELKRENRVLSDQMENIRQWVLSEDRIEDQMNRMKTLNPLDKEEGWKLYFQKRKDQMAAILNLQMKAIPAKVIYRDPSSWSSFVWLDIGERQNKALKEVVIAKNSPVVMGNILVGVVEEVGEKQCKVRLITDANLFPAVRSIRGGRQDQFLLEQIEGLFQLLQTRKELFPTLEEERVLFSSLQKLASQLEYSDVTSYLAKGELRGSSLPLWRTRGQRLKGVGFNYDFSDEEGPSRDLRTGVSDPKSKNYFSLLKEGDLLVTSGFDGVFPAGLEVAFVSKVHRLKEGASSYEIEAQPLAENFNELNAVFVLPPLSSF